MITHILGMVGQIANPLDLRVIGNIVVSWVITLPAGALLAAIFFFLFKGIFGTT